MPAAGMIVGQCPGKTEDRFGRPFIGEAGDELNRQLAEVGLVRAEIYLTNAVKCVLPWDQKEPTDGQVKTCSRAYLFEEVHDVAPAIVLALGNPALRALTGHSGITKYRGRDLVLHKDFEHEAPVIVTYHPASVLPGRNPRYRALVLEDLMRFKRVLAGEHKEMPLEWVFA